MRQLIFLILTLFVCCQAMAEQNSAFSNLVQNISIKTQTTAMNFIETRHLHFLDQPIITKGVLIFKKPDYLEQQINFPQARRFIIQQQQLTIIENGKTHQVNLERYPNLWALTTTLQALLNNDSEFLSEYYNINIQKNAASWQLTLTPKPQVTVQIKSITILISHNQIKTLTMQFPNGDWLQQQLSRATRK